MNATLHRMLGREAHRVAREPGILSSHLHNWILLEEGNAGGAAELLERARGAMAGRTWLRLANRPPPPSGAGALLRVVHHAPQVNALAWAPDGSALASGGHDFAVRIWDPQTGASRFVLAADAEGRTGHADVVTSVAWAAGLLVSAGVDGMIRTWDPVTGEVVGISSSGDRIFAVARSPDGSRFASVGDDGQVWLGDEHEACGSRLVHAGGRLSSVAWSPDGGLVAAGRDGGAVGVWDADSGDEVAALADGDEFVQAVCWSPDGSVLASAGRDRLVHLWDAHSWERRSLLAGHSGFVTSLAWSPDGSRLASGGWDRTVRLWDPDAGRQVARLDGHTNWVLALGWSPDGAMLASGSSDGTVRLWDMEAPLPENVPGGHGDDVWALAFSPDGRVLASGSGDDRHEAGLGDNTVRVWDTATGAPLKVLEGHTDDVAALVWSPDGSVLASGSWDQTVRLWDAARGVERGVGVNTGGLVVAWSPDGRKVASTTGAERILVKDGSWRTVGVLDGHTQPVNALAWSPDGRLLASAAEDGAVRLWDPGRPDPVVAVMETHERAVKALAWSPDGRRLASGGGLSVHELLRMTGGSVRVESPSGRSWAMGAEGESLRRLLDCTVRLWDAETRTVRVELSGHDGPVKALAWSPDGALVLSGGEDSSVRVWDASSGECVALAYCRSWPLALRFDAGGRVVLVADDGAASGNRPIPYRFALETETPPALPEPPPVR